MLSLCLLYFAGIVLKMNYVEERDKWAAGILLLTVLGCCFLAVFSAICLEFRSLFLALKRARRCATILQALPQKDPPDNSTEFYDLQIPVERENMGGAFVAKRPEDLAHLSETDKLAVVRLLSAENETLLERFFNTMQGGWDVPLTIVRTSDEVDCHGKVALKFGRKTDESILAKAARPSILLKNPHFGIEHVRDTLRFKGVVYSFRDMLATIFAIDQHLTLHRKRRSRTGTRQLKFVSTRQLRRSRSESTGDETGRNSQKQNLSISGMGTGLCIENVAKLDIAKLRKPKEWGWRFLAFDFIMPNHQIVECYIVFTEMEAAKKFKDPTAEVCPHLSNHEIFEKWRPVDTSTLQGARLREFRRDLRESNRRYDKAWTAVLSHSSHAELAAFWKPLGEKMDGFEDVDLDNDSNFQFTGSFRMLPGVRLNSGIDLEDIATPPVSPAARALGGFGAGGTIEIVGPVVPSPLHANPDLKRKSSNFAVFNPMAAKQPAKLSIAEEAAERFNEQEQKQDQQVIESPTAKTAHHF